MSVARYARATKTTKISTFLAFNMFVARVAAGTSVTAELILQRMKMFFEERG